MKPKNLFVISEVILLFLSVTFVSLTGWSIANCQTLAPPQGTQQKKLELNQLVELAKLGDRDAIRQIAKMGPSHVGLLLKLSTGPNVDHWARTIITETLSQMGGTVISNVIRLLNKAPFDQAAMGVLGYYFYHRWSIDVAGLKFDRLGKEGVVIKTNLLVKTGLTSEMTVKTPETDDLQRLQQWLEKIANQMSQIEARQPWFYYGLIMELLLTEEEANRIAPSGSLEGPFWDQMKQLIHLLFYANNPIGRNEHNLVLLYQDQLYVYREGWLVIKEGAIGPWVDMSYSLWRMEFLKEVLARGDIELIKRLVDKAYKIYENEELYITWIKGLADDRITLEEIRGDKKKAEVERYDVKCIQVRRNIRKELPKELLGENSMIQQSI